MQRPEKFESNLQTNLVTSRVGTGTLYCTNRSAGSQNALRGRLSLSLSLLLVCVCVLCMIVLSTNHAFICYDMAVLLFLLLAARYLCRLPPHDDIGTHRHRCRRYCWPLSSSLLYNRWIYVSAGLRLSLIYMYIVQYIHVRKGTLLAPIVLSDECLANFICI